MGFGGPEVASAVPNPSPIALLTTFPIDTNDANSRNDLESYSLAYLHFAVRESSSLMPASALQTAIAPEKSSPVESPALNPIAFDKAWLGQFLEFDAFADQQI